MSIYDVEYVDNLHAQKNEINSPPLKLLKTKNAKRKLRLT